MDLVIACMLRIMQVAFCCCMPDLQQLALVVLSLPTSSTAELVLAMCACMLNLCMYLRIIVLVQLSSSLQLYLALTALF